jgi:prepilin-type N-terminal cleavage/methylation domain-containing protein/prepilin-type processing-associated H-X9-DG protein
MLKASLRGRGFTLARAFTLVELLVVIGIIAVLISILLPTLSKARESANRAACGSNMRQIHAAIAMYESQYKRMPGTCLPFAMDPYNATAVKTGDPQPPGTQNLIGTTWGGNPNTGAPSLMISIFLTKQLNGNRSVWFCPSAQPLRENAVPVSGTFAGKVLGYSYKFNNQTTTCPRFYFGSWTASDAGKLDEVGMLYEVPKRSTQIRNPQRTTWGIRQTPLEENWEMSDLDGRNFDTSATGTFGIVNTATYPAPPTGNYNDRPYQPVHYTKKRGRNYCFFDGHVEFRFTDMEPANP